MMDYTFSDDSIPKMLELFKACLDHFRAIRFGRAFEDTFSDRLIKIEITHAMFNRWGDSLGLLQKPLNPKNMLDTAQWDQGKLKDATKILARVQSAFDSAKNLSNEFKDDTRNDGDDLDLLRLLDEEVLDIADKKVISSLRGVACDAPQVASSINTVTLDLYSEPDFLTLIHQLYNNFGRLVKLSPALHTPQKELCKKQVQNIDLGSVPRLLKINNAQDKILDEVLKEREIPEGYNGHYVGNVQVGGKTKTHVGDKYKNELERELRNVYVNSIVGTDEADIRAGHDVEVTDNVAIERMKLRMQQQQTNKKEPE